ncbi:MAG: flavodoxin family protein [Oscillospiraceae bacterium]|nr:flavodoxin family protein [Oscillospiraceae bacterium]
MNNPLKVLVIFASHRMGGKNAEIESAICPYISDFDFDFIHLAEHKVESCTSCHRCGQAGYCVLPPSDKDRFHEIFDKMQAADAIFIISPVYANIPSRLTALFERLTSVLFDTGKINTDQNPLLNKKAAVFSYCSAGVCDDSPIKLICDKFFMKNYRYDRTTYNYLNSLPDPRTHYGNITDYVTDTLESLKQ